jgi:signal transduction histidine kinase
VMFSPQPNHEITSPQPFISGIKALNENLELSQNLNLKYFQNDVTLNFLGFWYQSPENLNFRYKLENYDRDWITSRNYSVTYSSLPPGEYTFRLKASDSEDFTGLKESSFHFIVNPPFWRTIWFYVLSGACLTLLIIAFVKYREKQLQNDKRILEAKNAELKKINMELDKFVYSVSHDLRAPLLSMLGIVQISEEEAADGFIKDNLGFLKDSIHKLDGFIKDILEYSRNSRTDVQKQEIDFKEMLMDITNNLKYMGTNDARQVDIKYEINNQQLFLSDKSRISIVLNNLISNAIRYHDPQTDNPFVDVQIDMSDTETGIIVKDNGIGISKENQEKIFDMFYRVSENSVGSGLGLYIVKEIVEKLNGQIEVESEPGKGTAFSIHIPNNCKN